MFTGKGMVFAAALTLVSLYLLIAAGRAPFTPTSAKSANGGFAMLTSRPENQPGASGTLLGASKDGQLFSIDLASGAGTFIGMVPTGPHYGATTEIVFNNTTRRAFSQFNADEFAGREFDINTGAGIGNTINDNFAFNGLEWVGSTLYGAAIRNEKGFSQLRTLDPFTGASDLIGSTGVGPINGLAYDQATGIMYGSTGGSAQSKLVMINLTTGAATTVGTIGFDEGSLEFGPDGNLYAGGSDGSGNLYRVDRSTGAGTLVGPTGFANVTGLALVTAASPTPTPTPPPSVVQFSSSNYGVVEDCTFVTITVNRLGSTSSPATVNYSTSDVTASERRDYITAMGTLSFAVGEASKSFAVLINEDSYVEGSETFNVSLSNPIGASLGAPAIASVTITDDQTEPSTSAIDDAATFVCQHYHDFLNRQADISGQNFWTNEITSCGTDQACIAVKRINTSAAFYVSIEFQQTGYLVERMYKAAYGDVTGTSTLNGAHTLAVPIIRLNEFLPDTQRIGLGVVVGQGSWQQVLESNKQAFVAEFVQRSRFTAALPTTMTPTQFIDKLNQNAGMVLSATERTSAINFFGNAADTNNMTARAQALRQVAEDNDLSNAEFDRAFVLMQYFGYLRRNPNDTPDSDHTGYEFWLTKLNAFNGNYIDAEMVKAFITSIEYRERFGP